jgi:hypothetical protein
MLRHILSLTSCARVKVNNRSLTCDKKRAISTKLLSQLVAIKKKLQLRVAIPTHSTSFFSKQRDFQRGRPLPTPRGQLKYSTHYNERISFVYRSHPGRDLKPRFVIGISNVHPARL